MMMMMIGMMMTNDDDDADDHEDEEQEDDICSNGCKGADDIHNFNVNNTILIIKMIICRQATDHDDSG